MNILDLVPKASAQADATAQPTFGVLEGGTSGASSRMLVSSSNTEVTIGDTFTVTVAVNTNDIAINEYVVLLEYDPAVFSVIDQDSNSNGTQVTLLDTVFSIDNPEQNNLATSDGLIQVDASLSSGSSLTVNRDVIEVTFQAQSAATSDIVVRTGVNGSQLIRANGSSVSFNANQVTIDAVQTTGNGGIQDDQDDQDNQDDQNDQSDNSQNNQQQKTITEIPDTAITDSLEGTLGLGIGASLIIFGILLVLRRSPQKDKGKND